MSLCHSNTILINTFSNQFYSIRRTMIIHNSIQRFVKSLHVIKTFRRRASGNVTVSILPNGLRVASEETDRPLACLRLFVKVGSRYENADTHGLTHFIEHLAFKGFNSMSKPVLESTIANLGANLDAVTTREYQIFTAICPSSSAVDVLCILAKIITDLELSEAEMACEKENIETEARDFDMDYRTVMFEYLSDSAFQGTPLGKRVTGPTKNIERFSRACAYHYVKKNYTPLRIVLATSGGVTHEKVMSAAQQSFCNLQCSTELAEPGPCRFTASQIIYRDDSMPFAHVSLAVEVPGYNSDVYLPLMVAKHIIGAWDTSMGGTYRHAPYLAIASACTHLCEKYESFYLTYSDVGLWGAYIVCPRMAIDDIVHILFSTWMSLCSMTRDADVQRAINATKLELVKRVDGSMNSSFNLGLQVLFREEPLTLEDMFEKLSTLNANTLKDTMYEYIYNKTVVVSAVGPTEGLPDYNRLQAGTYWIRV